MLAGELSADRLALFPGVGYLSSPLSNSDEQTAVLLNTQCIGLHKS